jgi:hypothetical protein
MRFGGNDWLDALFISRPVNHVTRKMLKKGIQVPRTLANIDMFFSINSATMRKSIDAANKRKKDAVLNGE